MRKFNFGKKNPDQKIKLGQKIKPKQETEPGQKKEPRFKIPRLKIALPKIGLKLPKINFKFPKLQFKLPWSKPKISKPGSGVPKPKIKLPGAKPEAAQPGIEAARPKPEAVQPEDAAPEFKPAQPAPKPRPESGFARLKISKPKFKIPRPKLPKIDIHSRSFLIFAGILALIIIIALAYGSWYTSQPSFCASCHEMKPSVDAWQTSVHADVGCYDCHYTGFFSFFEAKAWLISDVFSHYAKSYKQPLNAGSELSKHIGSATCLQCHTPKRIITPRRVLTMNHNIHIEKGINCTTCHNRVGHPSAEGYRTNVSMQGCFRCHGLSKTAIAPGRCSICHPKTFDLLPSSGSLNHKRDSWLHGIHGKTALKNINPCMTCHQKTFCMGCHGVEVPHPDKFRKQDHGDIGSKNPTVCQKCHKQADFCNACHHKSFAKLKKPDGPWVPTHKYIVAQVGPAACFDCHAPTFCAYCHVRGELEPRTKRPQ